MSSSILNDIKKLLGIDSTDTSFDTDIIIHINTAFVLLARMGVGPEIPFTISGATTTWADFLGSDASYYSMVKTWTYLKVKTMFDPTGSGIVKEAYDKVLDELEFTMQGELMKEEANQNGSSD